VGEFVRALVASQSVTAVHDVSDGGLLVAITEMALSGNLGAELISIGNDVTAFWFSEDQTRYIVTAPRSVAVPILAMEAGVSALPLGTVAGCSVSGIPLTALREASDSFFRDWMEG
jgi:phosphoribosylformylglycinamidine synthase